MRSIRLATIVTAGAALSACASGPWLSALRFDKAPDSGADSDRVFLVQVKAPAPLDKRVVEAAVLDPDIRTALTDKNCATADQFEAKAEVKVAPLLVSLISAAAQLTYEQWVQRRQAQIEALVEASKVTYSATVLSDPAALASGPCLVLFRYGIKQADDKQKQTVVPGMAAVFRLEQVDASPPKSAAVLLTPVHVRFFNAVAQTMAAVPPTIDASIAISLKAVGRQESTMPRLLPTGDGVITLAKLPIGPDSPSRCGKSSDSCGRSDLVPFPLDRGPISLTLALTEQGQLGFNSKRALAELEALKAAYGPALAEGLKGQLEK
jgi:hypothetical protein